MIRLTYCHPKTIVFLEYVVACVMCGVVGALCLVTLHVASPVDLVPDTQDSDSVQGK